MIASNSRFIYDKSIYVSLIYFTHSQHLPLELSSLSEVYTRTGLMLRSLSRREVQPHIKLNKLCWATKITTTSQLILSTCVQYNNNNSIHSCWNWKHEVHHYQGLAATGSEAASRNANEWSPHSLRNSRNEIYAQLRHIFCTAQHRRLHGARIAKANRKYDLHPTLNRCVVKGIPCWLYICIHDGAAFVMDEFKVFAYMF